MHESPPLHLFSECEECIDGNACDEWQENPGNDKPSVQFEGNAELFLDTFPVHFLDDDGDHKGNQHMRHAHKHRPWRSQLSPNPIYITMKSQLSR
jgi:hypothetical protein